jgi:hypothetical protein
MKWEVSAKLAIAQARSHTRGSIGAFDWTSPVLVSGNPAARNAPSPAEALIEKNMSSVAEKGSSTPRTIQPRSPTRIPLQTLPA